MACTRAHPPCATFGLLDYHKPVRPPFSLCLQKGPLKGEDLEQHFLSLRHDINPKGIVPQEGPSSDTDGEAGGQL